jgi:AraC-like DNA-binding protein
MPGTSKVLPNPPIADTLIAYTNGRDPGPRGIYDTGIHGLALIRSDVQTPLQHQLYEPAVIVVIQGAKDIMLGDTTVTYTAGQYLVLTVGLPVLAKITVASERAPYLALAFTVDLRLIRDLMLQTGPVAPAASAPSSLGLFIGELTGDQAGCIARIAALLETPDALRVLFPSIARELFYWFLTGPDGAEFRRLSAPDSHAQRIADAITAMRAGLTETLPIERLAQIAHMSPSSFHHHFKAVTSMSPLQYQKQLRLLEARRLMLTGDADATRAAYEVGYESTSQFSREYARMFGAPPRRDITGFRTLVG